MREEFVSFVLTFMGVRNRSALMVSEVVRRLYCK
jgi:hypothetical protein